MNKRCSQLRSHLTSSVINVGKSIQLKTMFKCWKNESPQYIAQLLDCYPEEVLLPLRTHEHTYTEDFWRYISFQCAAHQIIEPTASASYLTTLRKQPSVSDADKLTLVNSQVSKFTFQQDGRCRLCCVYYRSLAQSPLIKLTIFSNNVQ